MVRCLRRRSTGPAQGDLKIERADPTWPPINLAREHAFDLGRLLVRPSKLEVEADGRVEVLQRRTMQVLVALAHSASSIVSHDELNQRCWGGLSVSEDAISRCIGQLRRLALHWSPPVFEIATTAGVGYRLEAGGATIREDPPKGWERSQGGGSRWGLLIVASGALGILAVAAGVFAWQRAVRPAEVVALTSFDPLGGAQASRSVGRAIDAELPVALNAIEVSARALPKPESYAAPARQRVGLILDGTVEATGDNVHATIRLVDVASAVVIWSSGFDRRSDDVKTLPSEIAAQGADMVAVAIFAKAASPPLRGAGALAALLAAHDALRWNRSQDWARRIQLARDLTRIDPQFAFGRSMLSWADTNAVRLNAFPEQSAALSLEARREAQTAIQLDPDDAGAYFALAMQQTQIAAREAVLAQGLARDSHPASLRAALNAVQSNSLLSVGRVRSALPYAERALARDPLSPTQMRDAANAYLLAGRKDDAEDLLARGLKLWPDHPDIQGVELYKLTFFGPTDAAGSFIDNTAHAAFLGRAGAAAWREYCAAKLSSETSLRERAMRDLVELTRDGLFDPRIATLMLAQLGDLDDAFAIMLSLRNDISDVSGFQYSSAAAPLRRDPRFLTFARASGLFTYWRQTGLTPDLCQGSTSEPWCGVIDAERQRKVGVAPASS